MRKWKMMLLVMLLTIVCVGCENKEESDTENTEQVEQIEQNDTESEMNVFTLSTEDGVESIEIAIPGEFEETDYISDSWLALEVPGEDEESSTQLMMYLEVTDASSVEDAMLDEVDYLISANSDGKEVNIEVENVSALNREWSYFTYDLEGLEGYKMWVELEDGCVLAGTIENIGEAPKPVYIEELIKQIDKTIITD